MGQQAVASCGGSTDAGTPLDEAGSAARKLIRLALETSDVPAVGATTLPVYTEMDMQLQRYLPADVQQAVASCGGSTDAGTPLGGESMLVDNSVEQADRSRALAAVMLHVNVPWFPELAALPTPSKDRLEARIASVLQEEFHNLAAQRRVTRVVLHSGEVE